MIRGEGNRIHCATSIERPGESSNDSPWVTIEPTSLTVDEGDTVGRHIRSSSTPSRTGP